MSNLQHYIDNIRAVEMGHIDVEKIASIATLNVRISHKFEEIKKELDRIQNSIGHAKKKFTT